MQAQFSLLDEPWIPIVGAGLKSLDDLFTEPYGQIGGSSTEKISLYKFLLAIVLSAYCPDTESDWFALKPEGMAKKVRAYLQEHRNQFDLFGEHPFLQFHALKASVAKPFSTIIPEIASGNTTVLTQQQSNRDFSFSDQAIAFLTFLNFSLGGKKTDNALVLTKGYAGKSKSSKPGPALDSFGLLHTIALGSDIWQTLWMNMWTREILCDQKMQSIFPKGLGQAPWELMPEGEDCNRAKDLKGTLLGRLVPLSRFALIEGQTIYLTEGIQFPGRKEGVLDPTASVILGKKARYLWVDPTKRPWRELTAILSVNQSIPILQCSQLSVFSKHAQQLRTVAPDMKISFWSGGLRVSSQAGEQYVSGADDYVDSSLSLQLQEFCSEPWYVEFCKHMKQLDTMANDLRAAVSGYFKSMKLDDSGFSLRAVGTFWERAERSKQELCDACAISDDKERLLEMSKLYGRFIQNGKDIYSQECSHATAKQMQAWVENFPNFSKKFQ